MLTVRFIQPSPDLAAAVLNYGCSAGTLAGPGLRLPMAARGSTSARPLVSASGSVLTRGRERTVAMSRRSE